jgi:hypothetical protein
LPRPREEFAGRTAHAGVGLVIHHVRRGTWATPPEVKLTV